MVMLARKMFRDIWKNKVQFSAIFIMLFLGVFIFAGISSEWYGLEYYSQQYLQDSHFEDAVVYLQQGSQQEVNRLLENQEIQQVEARTLISTTLSQNPKKEIDLHVMETNEISKLHVVSGVAFSNQIDGIWLDAMFADENDYQLGEVISLKLQEMIIEKKIVGLVYSPEYIYGVQDSKMVPDYKNYGFAFTSASYFPYSSMLTYNQMVIRSTSTQLKSEIENTLQDKKVITVLAKEHPSVSMIADEIAQHQSMGNVFSLAFLVIAMLTTITTMHRMLQSQRIQIGILKALGFSNRKLFIHFICHSGVICLLGATMGYISGSLILPKLIYPFMQKMYVLPTLQSRFLPYGWLLPVLCFLVCLGISLYVCRRYVNSKAATILQGNRVINKHRLTIHQGIPLPFRYQWNLRDIMRNRMRAMMTIFGVLGCTALLFCSFGLYDTMTRISSFAFEDIQRYQCKVTLNTDQQETIDTIKEMMHGQEIMEASATIKYNGQQKDGTITVLEDTTLVSLATSLTSYTSLNEGVALSYTLANQWDVEIGDTIEYRLYAGDAWQRKRVTSIIRTPISQGITILKKEYITSNKTYVPSAIIGNTPSHLDSQNPAVQSIQDKEELMQSMNSLLEGMVMIIVILVLGAIILGGVVLYNLGVLSYLERYRELATLKVLGFQDQAVKKILIQQNIWLATIGICLGLFAGYGLLVYMMTTLPDAMDIVLVVKPASYLYASIGTFALSWIISFFLSRKTKHIDMVAALKINE